MIINKVSPNTENKTAPPPASNPIFAPIPTKPAQISNPPALSNLPPPLSMPPPPAPPSTGLSAGSNPYAAKGALNKKVYDTGIVSVAPVQALNPAFIKPEPIAEQSNNLFMPPPLSASSSSSSLSSALLASPPSFPSAPPNSLNSSIASPPLSVASNLYMPPQPQIIDHSVSYQSPSQPPMSNLNDRLSSSLSFSGSADLSSSNSYSQQANQNKNVWNWFSQNKILNTFVEKAKVKFWSFFFGA
jgi:hypothetical protein